MNETMIEDSVGRLFGERSDRALIEQVEAGGFADRLWADAVAAGFTQVLVAESDGGIGGDWTDAWPILVGLGRHAVPLPLAETIVGSMLLSAAGIAPPDGPIALVEADADADGAIEVAGSGDAIRLSGRVRHIAWARHACAAVVSLPDGRIAQVDLHDRATVSIGSHRDLARMPSDTVTFSGARPMAIAAAPLPGLALPVRTLSAIARGATMVGALESVLAQSVRYANDRIQFGKPIGRNQAVQQQLALFAGELASARAAARAACEAAPGATHRAVATVAFDAAVAKIRCGEAATRCTAIAHQVHGAIGFTAEHPLNFVTRRLWAWRADAGSDAWWAERLGRAAIEAGGGAFWPAITARRFEPDPAHAGATAGDTR